MKAIWTKNNDYNVTAVGDAITDVLNKRGIKTMHDTTVHDSTYSGSYDRSAQTVESIMETNTDIKVIIDIHRDAIGNSISHSRYIIIIILRA